SATPRFEMAHLVEPPPGQWIEGTPPSDDRLGYDPWRHTVEGAEKLAKAAAAAGASLVAVEPGIIDTLWTDRPPPPLGPIALHDIRFAGEEAATKLAQIQPEIAKPRSAAL